MKIILNSIKNSLAPNKHHQSSAKKQFTKLLSSKVRKAPPALHPSVYKHTHFFVTGDRYNNVLGDMVERFFHGVPESTYGESQEQLTQHKNAILGDALFTNLDQDVVAKLYGQDQDNNSSIYTILRTTVETHKIIREETQAIAKAFLENKQYKPLANSELPDSLQGKRLIHKFNTFLFIARKLERDTGVNNLTSTLIQELANNGFIKVASIESLLAPEQIEQHIEDVKDLLHLTKKKKIILLTPTKKSCLVPPCYSDVLKEIIENAKQHGIDCLEMPDEEDNDKPGHSIEAEKLRECLGIKYLRKVCLLYADQPETKCYRVQAMVKALGPDVLSESLIIDHHGDECLANMNRIDNSIESGTKNNLVQQDINRLESLLAEGRPSDLRLIDHLHLALIGIHPYTTDIPNSWLTKFPEEPFLYGGLESCRTNSQDSYLHPNHTHLLITPNAPACTITANEMAGLLAQLTGRYEEFNNALCDPLTMRLTEEAIATDVARPLLRVNFETGNDAETFESIDINIQTTILDIVKRIRVNPEVVYAKIYKKAAEILNPLEFSELTARERNIKAALSIAAQMKNKIIEVFGNNDAELNPVFLQLIINNQDIRSVLSEDLVKKLQTLLRVKDTKYLDLNKALKERLKWSLQTYTNLVFDRLVDKYAKVFELITSNKQSDGITVSNSVQIIVIKPNSPLSLLLEQIVPKSQDPKAAKIILGNNAEHRGEELSKKQLATLDSMDTDQTCDSLSKTLADFYGDGTNVEGNINWQELGTIQNTASHYRHGSTVAFLMPTEDPDSTKDDLDSTKEQIVSVLTSLRCFGAINTEWIVGIFDQVGIDTSDVGHNSGNKGAGKAKVAINIEQTPTLSFSEIKSEAYKLLISILLKNNLYDHDSFSKAVKIINRAYSNSSKGLTGNGQLQTTS